MAGLKIVADFKNPKNPEMIKNDHLKTPKTPARCSIILGEEGSAAAIHELRRYSGARAVLRERKIAAAFAKNFLNFVLARTAWPYAEKTRFVF